MNEKLLQDFMFWLSKNGLFLARHGATGKIHYPKETTKEIIDNFISQHK